MPDAGLGASAARRDSRRAVAGPLLLSQILTAEERRDIDVDSPRGRGARLADGGGAGRRGRPCLSQSLAAGPGRQRGLWRASSAGLRSPASFQFPAFRPHVPGRARCPGRVEPSRARDVLPRQRRLRLRAPGPAGAAAPQGRRSPAAGRLLPHSRQWPGPRPSCVFGSKAGEGPWPPPQGLNGGRHHVVQIRT